MRIAIFGSASTIFVKSYMKLLEDMNHDVIHFNNSLDHLPNSINYKDKKIISSKKMTVKRIVKWLKLDKRSIFLNFIEKREIQRELTEIEKDKIYKNINKINPDLIMFFWGTTLRSECKFLDSLQLTSKKVLIVNTYPTRTRVDDWKDNKFIEEDRKYFSRFSDLILPSNYLKDIFIKSEFINPEMNVLVNPDFIYTGDSFVISSQKNKRKNKIIFLGNTDFSNRSVDDISATIAKLASSGVTIYLQESVDAKRKFGTIVNVKFFKPFDFNQILNADLINFINEFDGVLYSYNDVSNIRYNGSITTRMLLAERSSIPVFIYGEKPLFLSDNSLSLDCHDFNDIDKLADKLKSFNMPSIDENKYKVRINKFIEFIER